MKVGILTWYFGANYGAKAQSYALMKTLFNMGHDTYMINYKPDIYKKMNIKTSINIKKRKLHPILVVKGLIRNRRFEKFNAHYNETTSVENGKDIDKLHLDYVVFGSDAVFNVWHKLFRPVYMGVGINKTKKISYAPSCEYLDPEFVLDEDCIESLKEFQSISVRDENTRKLIKNNTDIDPVSLLDPTLLYDFKDITCNWKEDKYILIYAFHDWEKYQNELREFARAKDLKIIAIGRYCKWADKSYMAASFEQWICSFRNASYVFTDSFHGTVFAIKNNKEMILCSRADKEEKIKSLLNDFGIKRGFYDGSKAIGTYLKEQPIDFNQVGENMKRLVNKSKSYLESGIK